MISKDSFQEDVLFDFRAFLRSKWQSGDITDSKKGSRSEHDKFVWAGKTVEGIGSSDHLAPFVVLKRARSSGTDYLGNANPDMGLKVMKSSTIVIRVVTENTRQKQIAGDIEAAITNNPDASGTGPDGRGFDLSILHAPDMTSGFHDRDEFVDHGFKEMAGEVTWRGVF